MGTKLKEILAFLQWIISNTKLHTTMSMAFNDKNKKNDY